MPAFPRPEKLATWLLESVLAVHGKLVSQNKPFVDDWSGVQMVTSLVILRNCSTAPTVITFLATPGERIESATPPLPPSLAPPPGRLAVPPLPVGNTYA